MSIAVWKTILGLAKAAAVLVIVASGFLFWSHRTAMAKGWTVPDFSPKAQVRAPQIARIDSLSIALGRFQREQPKEEAPKEEEKPKDLTTALAELGEITNAIVYYGPYEPGGLAPAIIFRWKQKPAGEGDVRTIRLGEALFSKPDPRSSLNQIPVKYKFIGCEPDPEHPGWTYFVFDVKCDETDIQKARWKGEEPAKEMPKSAESSPLGPAPVSTDKMYVGDVLSAQRPKAEEPKPEVQVEPVPVPPQPQEPITVEQAPEPAGSLFDQEEGASVLTQEGVDYLEKNYEKIVKDTRTAPYRDREGRTGLRVIGIANASVANQFGIRKDDVILSINGIPVSNQSEAVNAVKGELKKKPAVRYINVKIRRRGADKELRFDTRDPATRRAAQKGFR